MQPAPTGVLYVYQCATCRHRGEVRRDDDSHDGQSLHATNAVRP